MWSLPQSILWLARRQAGSQLGFHYFGADTINNDEAFAQRINGDLHLGDFQKAMEAYQADPGYWHKIYGDDPQFSDSHTPEAAHGGPVPPSQYFPDVPMGAGTGAATSQAAPPSTPGSLTPFIDRYIRFGSAPLPNAPDASVDPAIFADRFGNWATQPAGAFGNIDIPAAPTPSGRRSQIPDDVTPTPAKDDVPVRRLANLSLPTPVDAPPLAPGGPPPFLGGAGKRGSAIRSSAN